MKATAGQRQRFVRAASADEIEPDSAKVVTLNGHGIALFNHEGRIWALDNRCPHMGFPLHRGSLEGGILTCDWHHARFDLSSGGTFDLWADDVRTFPVEVRDGEVFVDVGAAPDMRPYYKRRLRDGLEHVIPLLLAKGSIALLDAGEEPTSPFSIGLEFGARYRRGGWQQGLTMHTCFANLLPYLDREDGPSALYQGLSAVARDCMGQPARFEVEPLPGGEADPSTLKRWFRSFVEVRDEEGAERCLVSAIRSGATPDQVADMLFAAATDHRYIDIGHVADFTNKAFEALDIVGWEHAELVLTSLVGGYARASRSEERLEWRHPVDVVAICEHAFAEIEPAMEKGRARRGSWGGREDPPSRRPHREDPPSRRPHREDPPSRRPHREEIVPVLLGTDARAIADALLEAVAAGATESELGATVAYAAALRIARFPTSNEFGDWDTALHTFSFANAVHQGLRRAPSAELLRGVFDAAMSVYLDRFLNAPVAPVPDPGDRVDEPDALLAQLPELFDHQQQVNQAGRAVGLYLNSGGDPVPMMAVLGKLLLREDRDFHTIQTMEAAFRQYEGLRGTYEGALVLMAAARYLAAHAPTVRSQGQTYRIAQRLYRGESVYEGG